MTLIHGYEDGQSPWRRWFWFWERKEIITQEGAVWVYRWRPSL